MRKLGLLFATSALSCALAVANAATPLTTQKQKLSYAMGYHNAVYLKKNNTEFNLPIYSQGFGDAISGKKPALSQAEMQKIVSDYMKARIKQFRQLYNKQMKQAQNAMQFFKNNANKPGVKTTASGLQYKVLQAGSGPRPKATDQVVVDYEGRFPDGTVFDSSAKHGGSATFPVNGVVPGFKEALMMMPVGSTYEVYIPPNLGYGSRGIPGAIPPNSILIFKLHLKQIKQQ